ncbi:hypothetical protein BON22_4721 [Cyberlindnera fabianii]|nr:hypothetical protein BON22_4721 [Cyberlindnera fabianii]
MKSEVIHLKDGGSLIQVLFSVGFGDKSFLITSSSHIRVSLCITANNSNLIRGVIYPPHYITYINSFTITLKKGKKKGSKGSRKSSSSNTLTVSETPQLQFGDWDPLLTNCQHYMNYHRDAPTDHPFCLSDDFITSKEVYNEFHSHHLNTYHIDKEHPGFCIEGGADDLDSADDAPLDLDLDHSDPDSLQPPPFPLQEGKEIFSMDLPSFSITNHAFKRHKVLLKLLGLNDDSQISKAFTIIAALTDPLTQPMESDIHVMSIDLISQLIIAFCYNTESVIPGFDLSIILFKIIDSSLQLLHCHDEVKIRNLNNSDIKVDWRPRVLEWTPSGLNQQDIHLMYMVDCVCVYTIFKLYNFEEPDLCLNPFLGYFIKLWKIFTNVVLLGLEVDRRVEQDPNNETPEIIKQVIRGSSAIRYVLASILNEDLENRVHDFYHLNIVHFLSPYGRRNGSGALYADVRWYVGAMLALGSELNEVVETLVDLEPNDRYDEDVKYMFAHEFEDFHHKELFPDEYDEDGEPKEQNIIYEDEFGVLHKVVHQRCTCEFFDHDEVLEEEEEEQQGHEQFDGEDADEDGDFNTIPKAVRGDQDIEFDELGRDWRDVPRGGNIFFNGDFIIDDSKCYSWPELSKVFDDMKEAPVSEEVAGRVVMTVAKAVKFDFEQNINNTVSDKDTIIPADVVTPDKIYEKWSAGWTFEAMLALNPIASYAMLDEMLMAHGYRRVLIWFITHMGLSFTLMNYIFELVNGLRGETRISKTFKFSRQGSLEISEIEKSMLLHEFLNNCLIYLSRTYDSYKSKSQSEAQNASEFERCIKIVKLICLMMTKLLERDGLDMDEYKVELTSLLINWIAFVPEAKTLFFQINNNTDNNNNNNANNNAEETILKPERTLPTPSATTAETTSPPSLVPAVPMRHKKFNQQLKVSLGNVIKKLDNGTLLFRPFFELINYDTGSTETKSDEMKEDNQTRTATFEERPDVPQYVKGELKPIKRDEEEEHARVEEAFAE